MSNDNTVARLSALEAHLAALADIVGSTIAAVGMLNAHVSVTREPGDDLEAFRERMAEVQTEVQGLYERLESLWPET